MFIKTTRTYHTKARYLYYQVYSTTVYFQNRSFRELPLLSNAIIYVIYYCDKEVSTWKTNNLITIKSIIQIIASIEPIFTDPYKNYYHRLNYFPTVSDKNRKLDCQLIDCKPVARLKPVLLNSV